MHYKISAILLASGLSRRMGDVEKLLLPINGKPMLQYAVDLMTELSFEQDLSASDSIIVEKILVTSYNCLEHIKVPELIKSLINENSEIGQSESIKIGLREATGDAYLFLVADQPMLTPDDIKPLIITSQKNITKIIYPIIDSKPSSPTIFPPSFKNELLALTGDKGGREIRDCYINRCVPVNVSSPENFREINNMADYYNMYGKEITE